MVLTLALHGNFALEIKNVFHIAVCSYQTFASGQNCHCREIFLNSIQTSVPWTMPLYKWLCPAIRASLNWGATDRPIRRPRCHIRTITRARTSASFVNNAWCLLVKLQLIIYKKTKITRFRVSVETFFSQHVMISRRGIATRFIEKTRRAVYLFVTKRFCQFSAQDINHSTN